MGPERIAGNQYLFFLYKCVHRIRPVEIRYKHKLQCTVSDYHFLPVSCRNPDKIPVHDLLKEAQRASGCYDFHLRAVIKKPLHASCMIRFRVAHDKIIYFVYIDHFLQFFTILIEKLCLCRLKQNCLVSGFHHIGVIRRSELRVHDNVKNPKLVINNTRPVKIISQSDTFHVCLLFFFLF